MIIPERDWEDMPMMSLFRKKAKADVPPPEEWPRGTVELDDRSFDEFVDKFPLTMVEFWASWCAPCKAMRPIIRDIAKARKGKVAIGKVNIERHRKLAERFDVMSIPHVVYFSYGKQVDYSHGMMTRRSLEGKVKSLAKRYG